MQGVKFRRQQPIGGFIVDFASFDRGLVIGLDGGQHVESREHDTARDRWLASQGFQVLRFWNHEALGNPEGVLEAVRRAVLSR